MSCRSIRRWWVLPAVVLGVSAFAAGPASAQGDDPPIDAGLDGVEGDTSASATDLAVPPKGSTDVAVRVEVQQILAIDERHSFFEVDAVLTAQWLDKRRPESCSDKVYAGKGAEEALKSDVWAPAFIVVDGRGPRTTTALELQVACDGDVRYEERFTVEVTQRLTNLNDFPFDGHVIRFEVAPFGEVGGQAVRFRPLGESCGTTGAQSLSSKLLDKFEVEEWEFSPRPCVLVEDPPLSTTPPSLTTQIRIDRESAYFVMNVIAPLVLIVMISWVVFWMKPVLHERLGISLTALLTIVAFDFLTGDSLPRLSFTTRLDQFYNISYLFVALTILITFIATWGTTAMVELFPAGRASTGQRSAEGDDDAVGSGRHDAATGDGNGERTERTPWTVDRVARWAVPPIYALVVVLTLWAGVFSPGRREITSEPAAARQMADEREAAGQPIAREAADELEAADEQPDEADEDGAIDDQPEVLIAGASIDGTITGSERRREYVICTESEDILEVTMRRSPTAGESLDPVLDLFTTGDEPTLRAFDDDGAGGLDSRLVLPPEDPVACFVLIASDISGDGVGSYTLSVDRIEPADERAVIVDEPRGTDVVDEFADAEARFGVPLDELRGSAVPVEPSVPLNASIDEAGGVRAFDVCSQGDPGGYVLVRRPSALVDEVFDPIAALYAADGSVVAEDDDGAGGRDSLLVLPSGDAAGCFVLVVADFSRLNSGKFVVELAAGAPPSAEELTIEQSTASDLLFGRSFEEVSDVAEVVTTDSVERAGRIDDEQPLLAYRWCATPEAFATVVMEGEGAVEQQLDPLLVLYSEDGSLLGFDDDSADGRGSRVDLPAGEDCFVIVARDLTGAATGDFTVTVADVTSVS